MMPTTLLLALRRHTILRRAMSLAGYVGGTAAVVYGGVLFNVVPALSDRTLASGFWLTGGIMAVIGTYELRQAIHGADRTPDPSNPTA